MRAKLLNYKQIYYFIFEKIQFLNTSDYFIKK